MFLEKVKKIIFNEKVLKKDLLTRTLSIAIIINIIKYWKVFEENRYILLICLGIISLIYFLVTIMQIIVIKPKNNICMRLAITLQILNLFAIGMFFYIVNN